MDRVLVASTVIRSVGYDAEPAILEVEFHSGDLYRYFMVPKVLHDQLMAAPSKGKYFQANVRDRFPSERIRGPIVR